MKTCSLPYTAAILLSITSVGVGYRWNHINIDCGLGSVSGACVGWDGNTGCSLNSTCMGVLNDTFNAQVSAASIPEDTAYTTGQHVACHPLYPRYKHSAGFCLFGQLFAGQDQNITLAEYQEIMRIFGADAKCRTCGVAHIYNTSSSKGNGEQVVKIDYVHDVLAG